MGPPFSPNCFGGFLTQIKKWFFQDGRSNGIRHTRLFDPYKVNLRCSLRIRSTSCAMPPKEKGEIGHTSP